MSGVFVVREVLLCEPNSKQSFEDGLDSSLCKIKGHTKVYPYILAPATGIGLACGLGLPADLTVHWTVIQHRLPFDSR